MKKQVFLYLFLICLLLSLAVFLLTNRTSSSENRFPQEFPPWKVGMEDEEELHQRQGPSRNLQGALENRDLLSKTNKVTISPKRRFQYSIVQDSRHVAIDTVCHNNNQTWKDMTAQQRQTLAQRIVVNDEYQLLYCPVPLVGNGPWMKVLYFLGSGKKLSDISKVPSKELGNRKNFVYLNSFPPAEQEKRLHSYLKFTVSRHPFLRIAIAYKLKFEAENAFFHERYGKDIVQKYRKDAGSDPKGNDVKFSEFVRYLSDINKQEEMNEHWQLLVTLCRPCEVGYDFLLRHETLHQDSREVLQRAGLEKRVPVFPYDTWDHISSVYVHNLFNQIPPALMGRLVQQFAKDLDVFSYSSLFQ